MRIELLNCPCCGSAAKIIKTYDELSRRIKYIRCTSCGIQTKEYMIDANNAEMLDTWNRRET